MRLTMVAVVIVVVFAPILAQAKRPAVCRSVPSPPCLRAPCAPLKLKLKRYVRPEYPKVARTARVQATVTLSMRVGEDGRVVDPQIMSGHPFFTSSVLKAVKKWRYEPACLNGRPVALDQRIGIRFDLKNGVTVF